MADTVDSLNIEVQASATKANDALDKLIGKLDKLSTSLSQINGHNLVSLSSGVSRLSSAMQGMSSVRTVDFTNLAKNIGKMGAIDSASISSAATSVHQFSNALNSLGNTSVSGSAAQFGELAKGIAQLGYKSSTKAIENIPQLAAAMQQLMTTLSGAPKVSQNLIDMTNALAKLARTGASSGRAANSLSASLNTFSASTKTARTSSLSLASALGKLYASYWVLFRAFNKLGDAIEISSDLTEVQNVVDVTFGDMAYKVEEFAETSIEQFGMSELALKQYASRFQAMGSAMGIDSDLIGNANSYLSKVTNGYIGLSDSMSDVSLNLTKLTADMASFYNLEQDAVAEDLEAIFTGQTRPLRTYGLDLTQATLQEWALKQGLDADIQSMSQAEKTMLRYQYVMANTGASQGDFARTADTWANQVRILKQNFEQLAAVIGGVFINALKPLVRALNAAMSHIIAFAKTISNALGKIFGWTYEEGGGGVAQDFDDAADSADDIASGVGNAADNAKKLKQQLQGFDELNVLTSDSDSGSGGGSSSGSGGVSGGGASGGQWTKTDSILKEFESDIDSLYELGEYISEVLTDAMDSIDWNKAYEKARGFGSGLASFLNGLISPELFGATGRTIAGALNTAVYAALSFGETFDWTNFGKSIASGISNFFSTFDFAALAQTLNVWVDGLEETIGTAIENIEWDKVVEGISDFLSNLEFDTVAVVIGTLWLRKIGKIKIWNAVKEYVATKIGLLLSGFSIPNIIILIGSIVPRFQGTAGFDVLADWVITGIEDAMDKLLPDWVNDFIGKFVLGFSTAGVASGGNLIAAAIGGLFTSFPIEINWFGEGGVFSFEWTNDWFDEAKRAFKTAFDGKRNDLIDVGGWILEGILDGFVGAITFIFEPIARFFNEVVKGIKDIFGIASPAKEMKPLGEYILLGIIEGFLNKVSDFNTAISSWFNESVKPWFTIEKWSELGENVRTSLSTKWTEFSGWWTETGFANWWNEHVTPYFTKEKWSEISKGMKDGLTTKWNEFSTWWSGTGFYTWWNQHVAPYFAKDKWTFSGIKDGLASAWNAAIESIKGLWNTFATWLNNKLTINIDTSTLIGKGISEVLGTNVIKLGNIPAFATGGIVSNDMIARVGEYGRAEAILPLEDKRSMSMIADSILQNYDSGFSSSSGEMRKLIYSAVYDATLAAMKGNRENSGDINVQVDLDGDVIYRNMVKRAKEQRGTSWADRLIIAGELY